MPVDASSDFGDEKAKPENVAADNSTPLLAPNAAEGKSNLSVRIMCGLQVICIVLILAALTTAGWLKGTLAGSSDEKQIGLFRFCELGASGAGVCDSYDSLCSTSSIADSACRSRDAMRGLLITALVLGVLSAVASGIANRLPLRKPILILSVVLTLIVSIFVFATCMLAVTVRNDLNDDTVGASLTLYFDFGLGLLAALLGFGITGSATYQLARGVM